MMLLHNGWTKARVNLDMMEIDILNLRTTVTLQHWTFFSLGAMERWLKEHGYNRNA